MGGVRRRGRTATAIVSRNEVVALAAFAVLGFWMLGAHNRLVRLRQAIAAAFVLVDAQFRERHAQLTELVELTAAGLSDTPEAVQALEAARMQTRIAADQAALRPTSRGRLASLVLAEQVLRTALSRLVTLAKARAGLSSDPRLREVLKRLSTTQHRVSAARDTFNTAVRDYNLGVRQFPTRLISGLFGFRAAGEL